MDTLPTFITELEHSLYSREQTQALDAAAIATGISGFSLMQKAGKAAFECLQQQWPKCRSLLIFCGAGNNAGDGYVLGVLAKQAGLDVKLIYLFEPSNLQGEAAEAFALFQAHHITYQAFEPNELSGDLQDCIIVDAIFGTGLCRDIEGNYKAAINWINQQNQRVCALDIPSGLCANTGKVLGCAVKAKATISFIGKNIGLYQHQAKDYCGAIHFSNLDVPKPIYQQIPAIAELLAIDSLVHLIKARPCESHKGNYGHVLIIGGNYGFAGAACLASTAALRMGAGLVSLITRSQHINSVISQQAEIMAHGIDDIDTHAVQIKHLIEQASHIVIGPGLGQDDWANHLLALVLKSNKPTLFDADALNLIAMLKHDTKVKLPANSIITPHPGEAARLLSCSNQDIQDKRLDSVKQLRETYQCLSLLKGSGSIIAAKEGLAICPYGNPYMASGGMGDVLSGFIVGLWAQGLSASQALKFAVALHGLSADRLVQKVGGQGLVASDLISEARLILNKQA